MMHTLNPNLPAKAEPNLNLHTVVKNQGIKSIEACYGDAAGLPSSDDRRKLSTGHLY